MIPFTKQQIATLRTLRGIWPVDRFVLIGGAALRCFVGGTGPTEDLDLVLAVSLEEYPGGADRLPGWSRDRRREQRWVSPEAVRVDILPASSDLLDAGEIVWADGARMSLVGMRLAFGHGVPVSLENGLVISVAPVPVLAVLKVVAYLDDPLDRMKDLGDIAYMLEGFVGPTASERYDDEIFELGLRDEEVSPFLLGRRVAEIATTEEVRAVCRFLDIVLERVRPSQAIGDMARLGPSRLRRDVEQMLKRVLAFERGFSQKDQRQ